MANAGRFIRRLALAGLLAAAAAVGWVSAAGSPAPIDLLPAGAAAIVEVNDAEALAAQLKGTRFATVFAKSATKAWLEQTSAARSFDTLLADVRKATGLSLGRESAYDLLGSSAAVGWYPAAGGGAQDPPTWVAGGRLSWRAWAAASAFRAARRLGFGASLVSREEAAGRALYAVRGGGGQSLHLGFVGRTVVASPDRSLALEAARGGRRQGDADWRPLRAALPRRGEFFVWLRDRDLLRGVSPAAATPGRGVAALVRAGKTVEIDVAGEPAAPRRETAPAPLPARALLDRSPLFFLTSRDPVPAVLADLLAARRRELAKRDPSRAPPEPAFRPGGGYAVAVTESAGGSGLFPAPRGLLVLGMESAGEAARALPLLFPQGARTAVAAGTRALGTRESFPLAGEFELWGAAAGPRLVFATDIALIGAAAAEAPAEDRPVPDPGWQVRTVATISMDKALPLLRRWSAPLSGLLAARWPEAPDVTRDLDLLAAIGGMRLIAGTDQRRDRAALTLQLRDLP